MKTISLIGSTGSIGEQTLDVCRKHNIKIKALAAGSSVKRLAEQAHEFKPEYICIFDESKYSELKALTLILTLRSAAVWKDFAKQPLLKLINSSIR